MNFELRIVLDTSVIFSPSPTEPIRNELSKLIKESTELQNLTIIWYIPEIVMHERRYQLIAEATDLISATKKLKKLLGEPLDIAVNTIEERIENLINNIIEKNQLRIIHLHWSKIDWNEMMLDAAYRRPPFEPGDKEKGFRDALVVESYMQLLAESPVNPQLCRVVLATKDNLQAQTTNHRIAGQKNSHAPCNLEEIRGLINILVSQVSEKQTERVRELARDFFFTPGAEDSLFYKDGLQNKIEQKFHGELLSLPEGAERRSNDAWIITPPQFLKKELSRWTWISHITLEHSAYKTAYRPPAAPTSGSYVTGGFPGLGGPLSGTIFPTGQTWGTIPVYTTGIATTGFSGPMPASSSPLGYQPPSWVPREVLVATGKTVFEIEWSIVANDMFELSDSQINEVRLAQVAWY